MRIPSFQITVLSPDKIGFDSLQTLQTLPFAPALPFYHIMIANVNVNLFYPFAFSPQSQQLMIAIILPN